MARPSNSRKKHFRYIEKVLKKKLQENKYNGKNTKKKSYGKR